MNRKPTPAPSSNVEGEGSYTAARRHRKSAETFVEQGRVDQAAHDAKPDSPQEAREMDRAEEAGRRPARR